MEAQIKAICGQTFSIKKSAWTGKGYPSYSSHLTGGRKAVKFKVMRFPLFNPCGYFWKRIEMISSVYSGHVWTAIAYSDANRCSPCEYLMLCIDWTRVSSSFLWCTALIVLLYCLFSLRKSTVHFYRGHYSLNCTYIQTHAYGSFACSFWNKTELKLLKSWTVCLPLYCFVSNPAAISSVTYMYIYVYTLYFIVLCFYVQHLSVYPNAKSMLSYQIILLSIWQ